MFWIGTKTLETVLFQVLKKRKKRVTCCDAEVCDCEDCEVANLQ